MIYLYVKTHITTGLKYFGKTTRDDYDNYTGSGKYWLRHLRKHGFETKTELIFKHEDLDIIKEFAIQYSIENNIVESKEWANLKYENGLDGGSQSEFISDETKRKMSLNRRGKVGVPAGWNHSEETKAVMSKKAKKRCEISGPPKGAFKPGNEPINKGVPMSEEQKALLSEAAKKLKKKTCRYCNKSVSPGNYARWHGDNCKENHD
jgi:hypothetical protein